MNIDQLVSLALGCGMGILGWACKSLLSEIKSLKETIIRLDARLQVFESGTYELRIRKLEERTAILSAKVGVE